MLSYLEKLTLRLGGAIAEMPPRRVLAHAEFFKSQQRLDGGFAGREGESDLYYTGFGLRGLAILNQLTGETAQRSGQFLRSRHRGHESIVDFFSFVFGMVLLELSQQSVLPQEDDAWRQRIAEMLAVLRRDDGGYAKGREGRASSTYHTFLVVQCLSLLGLEIPQPQCVVDFLHSQQCEGGGFREIRVSKRAGTNPTAAAVATLVTLDALEPEMVSSTVDFLVAMQNDEGGLRANSRIPIADVLSTFTGLVTLVDLDADTQIDLPAVRRYVQAMENAQGGFHGAAWDTMCDVEYTFYGLGCLAQLYQLDPMDV